MKQQLQSVKQLHIAFVSDAIYPYNKGGKEKRIYELTTQLARRGHEVTIYCMKWWKGDNDTLLENGVVLKAISPLYPLYSGDRRSISQAFFFALSCFKLVNEKFDVLDVDHMPHLVLFPTRLITWFKRKQMIVTWHEVWGRKYWVSYLGLLGNLAFLVEWVSARLPDKIVAVSEHTKRKLQRELQVKKPMIVVPNGIDYSHIVSIKPAKELSDIIFAGRLLANKHVDQLISSVPRLTKDFPTIKVIIIGEGPEKQSLRHLIKELKLEENIRLYDFFSTHDQLYALFKSSKVFVSPSTREGFGIVALEANSCGLPVITTLHSDNATKDLIKEGQNGYFFAKNELAKTIKEVLKKKHNRTEIAESVKQYDWKSITLKAEEVYLS